MSNAQHIVCPHCNAVNRLTADRLGDNPNCGKCHRDLFTAHPADMTASGFQKQIERSDIPVLVDFWAPWCGPCKMMAPAFEQAAARLEPRVRVVKLNTENEQAIAAQYRIQSIPTLAIFRAGHELARQPGAMGMQDIIRWVESHI